MQIIKDMKYIKTMVEFHLKPDPKMKVQILHCIENLIDLDQILHDEGFKGFQPQIRIRHGQISPVSKFDPIWVELKRRFPGYQTLEARNGLLKWSAL